jgi:DNA polymerase I-like protein with 3'-5' exonuclease and polymerase domains
MILTNLKDAKEAIHSASQAQAVSVDVETTGLDMVDATVLGIGFATRLKEWYIDFPSLVETELSTKQFYGLETGEDVLREVWTELAMMFNACCKKLVGHNVPFDLWIINRELERFGLAPMTIHTHFWYDTLSMAALWDENLIGATVEVERGVGKPVRMYALSLKTLSYFYLGRDQASWDEDFEGWSPDERAAYGCADVRNTYDLAIVLYKALHGVGLAEYYENYTAPLCYVTHDMERNGIMVDIPKLLEVRDEMVGLIEGYTKQLMDMMPPVETVEFSADCYPGTKAELVSELEPHVRRLVVDEVVEESKVLTSKGVPSTSKMALKEVAPHLPEDLRDKLTRVVYSEPNPNSSQQLGDFLVSKGYRLPLTSTGQPSTKKDLLEELSDEYPDDPVWVPIANAKKIQKLEGTYVLACLKLAWEDDRVHPQWNQSGTATGRYSSTSSSKNKELKHQRGPAFQTIPTAKGEDEEGWGYNPREWFIAPPGSILCVSDLSQAEIRMLAVMSGCQALRDTILAGTDLHQSTADRMFGGWNLEKAEARKYAKTVNFGIMYGMGPKSLAKRLNITEEMAEEIIQQYYRTYPGVDAKKREVAQRIQEYGFVTTFLGRRRSPVLAATPPRVSVPPDHEQFLTQSRQVALWEALYDTAMKKSGFDESAAPGLIKSRAERQAFNTIIQGSVAEMINYGLIELVRRGWKVVGQVHDEVIVELPDDEKYKEALVRDLHSLFNIEVQGVPFRIDTHFGTSWACGKE